MEVGCECAARLWDIEELHVCTKGQTQTLGKEHYAAYVFTHSIRRDLTFPIQKLSLVILAVAYVLCNAVIFLSFS